jgi:hypothetical protein
MIRTDSLQSPHLMVVPGRAVPGWTGVTAGADAIAVVGACVDTTGTCTDTGTGLGVGSGGGRAGEQTHIEHNRPVDTPGRMATWE